MQPLLSNDELYSELRIRGHEYHGIFRGVHQVSGDGISASVEWNDNLGAFLESLFQIHYLKTDTRSALYPEKIRKLTFLGTEHQSILSKGKYLNSHFSGVLNSMVCGGVEMLGLETNHIERALTCPNPILKSSTFIGHYPSPLMDVVDAVKFCVDIAVENLLKQKMKFVEVSGEISTPLISLFQSVLNEWPLINGKCILFTSSKISIPGVVIQNTDLSGISNCSFMILSNGLKNNELVHKVEKSLNENSFLLSRENKSLDLEELRAPNGFNTIAALRTQTETLILLQRSRKLQKPKAIKISETDVEWIRNIQATVNMGSVILYSQNEKCSGALGICKSLRDGVNGELISCVVIDDENAPAFNIDNPFYAKQLNLGLSFNVLRNVYIYLYFSKLISEILIGFVIGILGNVSELKFERHFWFAKGSRKIFLWRHISSR